MQPLVEELPDGFDAVTAFARLRDEFGLVFLDSALRQGPLGRYSFVSAWPSCMMTIPLDSAGRTPLDSLLTFLGPEQAETVAGLPPFQGGVVALLAYDLNRSLEKLPAPRYDEFQMPTLAVGKYGVVLAFDHLLGRGWIISQRVRYDETSAEERLRLFKRFLFDGIREDHPACRPRSIYFPSSRSIKPDELAPQHAVRGVPSLTSNFSRDEYLVAVRRAIEYIHAGDIFQVNLAQRLLYPARDNSVDLYLRLRARNPATFAGYFDIGDQQVISASPERFLSIRDGVVEARPIKGTRGRSSRPEADLYAADDLQQSEKDRAENVMIVDLMRNDLARVCSADSVRVTQLCGLEVYQFVQHLVSVVQGKLRPECTPLDVLRAAFPGGSITGAPKVRAMEIIAELEPTARGAYCGSLGYIGFDGTMDFNILIRTITASRGWWQLPVGGGIVAQSHPEREYEETWQKALGMMKALQH
jgi:para-aminobenzoate synthetase component 1